MLRGDSHLIGLDIGTSGIRVVEVKGDKASPKLVTYGARALDTKILQSDAPVDQQQVMEATKQLLAKSRVSGKNVVGGLPTSKVFASLITLPKMSEAELAKAVAYQAEQYVPMALNQVKLDWMVVGDNPDTTKVDVLLVAAPITLSERYLNMLEGMGLDVIALEPDATALSRSLVPGSETVVVLDVGVSSTDLIITYQGKPRLIRSIPVGGDSFVKAAAQSLNLEHEQAYQFVYKFGLAEAKLEGQVRKALTASIEGLVSEVDKSNKFFASHYKDAQLSKLVLTGQASMVPEFPTHLANSLNLPVEIGNPWGPIEMNAEVRQAAIEVSSQFAVAVGLALRGQS